MTTTRLNLPLIRLLVQKDWDLFQKQLAAYVAAGVFALCLLGMATKWSFYVGAMMLMIIMIAASCFAIANSLVVERKEHTMAFVMSLPVSPLDFYLSKLIGSLVTFGVPFLLMSVGCLVLIVSTPDLTDGLFVYSMLIFGHIFLASCVSLGVAMTVESEGWNTFAMVGSMVLINPFFMALGQIPAIVDAVRVDAIAFSTPALAILLTQAALSVFTLVLTGWVHCRKASFY